MLKIARMKLNRICLITAFNSDTNIDKKVTALLEEGIRWIQYREKNKTRREMFYDALRLRKITRRFDACFTVNDYVDIALAVDADGVHLGQEDLPIKEARKILGDKIIGVSTHNLREAVEAEKKGADYIGFGSIFHTTTKDDIVIQGLDSLREIKKSVKIAVIAIGGITADNVRSVFDTGCDGAAVSSGLLMGDVRENARKFLRK